MKRVLILFAAFLFLGITSFKSGEGIKWMDFNSGYDLAKKKNKVMLVDVYTDWCGWCKRMDRDTYEHSEIYPVVTKDFVAIKFNPEVTDVMYSFEGRKYNGSDLAGLISNYNLTGYPTTIFIYPKEKKSEVIAGYKNAEQMKVVLADIKTKFYKK